VVSRIGRAPCPWCGRDAGYRHLTNREEIRRAPAVFAQSALSGLGNWARPRVYWHALMTPTHDLACLSCTRLVRVCPQCDQLARRVVTAMVECERCGTAYM
jgi:formamidopyrimidine-DNA glycosylase